MNGANCFARLSLPVFTSSFFNPLDNVKKKNNNINFSFSDYKIEL